MWSSHLLMTVTVVITQHSIIFHLRRLHHLMQFLLDDTNIDINLTLPYHLNIRHIRMLLPLKDRIDLFKCLPLSLNPKYGL